MKLSGFLFATLGIPSAAAAQVEANLDERLPIDPLVTIGTLDNGVRYYIRQNQRPENRAELRLVLNAGSVLEDDDQRGLAHVVEHMAFNGTESFPRQALVDYLEGLARSRAGITRRRSWPTMRRYPLGCGSWRICWSTF